MMVDLSLSDRNEASFSYTIKSGTIIPIQALARGYLVRKWMKQLRQNYCDIVEDLEKNPQVCVVWKSESPCRPQIFKHRKTGDKSFLTKKNNCGSKKSELERCENHFTKDLQNYQCDQCYQKTNTRHTSDRGRNVIFQETHSPQLDINNLRGSPVTSDEHMNERTSKLEPPAEDHECEGDSYKTKTRNVSGHVEQANQLPPSVHMHERSREPDLTVSDMNMVPNMEQQTTTQVTPHEVTFSKPDIFLETPVALAPQQSPLQEMPTFTELTSVWNESSQTCQTFPEQIKMDAAQLQESRRNVAMELLWVQQAINSRKHYLRLKTKIEEVNM
ncbi:hypothetical protein ScPMuIL_007875 [Solemya velum]